jgi:type 1 glutamine amidotransferase
MPVFRFCFSRAPRYSARDRWFNMHTNRLLTLTGALLLAASATVRAWDYDAHRLINQLALASLPTNFPAFVSTPAARERIAFLAGEADRWRNTPEELSFSHATGPDHYFDMEDLDAVGVTAEALPIFRYEFAAKLAAAHAAHPEMFPPIDVNRNKDHTQELIGALPWTLAENVGKLKSGFSYLKAFEQHGGTPDEIANAQANIVYVMGVMGHFVGDAAQPLHTTKHHHGWVGANPKGYTTDRGFHQWIDGSYFAKTGGLEFAKLKPRIRPARLVGSSGDAEELFRLMTAYLVETHKLVEALYQLQRDGKLSGEGAPGREGKPFLEDQLVRAGQMLGDLWFTAWQRAPSDGFLAGKLGERQMAKADKLRVLLVTGGHGYEQEPFMELFKSFSDVTFTHVEHTNAHALFTPAAAKDYDVLVLYDMWQKIGEAAQTNFVNLTTSGKGVVALHHSIANYNEWDTYADLVGARYYLRPKTINGVEKARSQYQHDVQIKVKIVDPQHPVTRGVQDFVIHDETYKGFDVAKDARPLLTTDEPLSGPVIGWAKQNGRSRWVFIQLGHDHFAYENPNYRQLVHQAIRWVARPD